MAASGEKPYRVYRGGRDKGHVPLDRKSRREKSSRRNGAGPGKQQRRRRWGWGRIVLVGVLVLVVLLALWSLAGYLSVRSGVSAANKRLPAGRRRCWRRTTA